MIRHFIEEETLNLIDIQLLYEILDKEIVEIVIEMIMTEISKIQHVTLLKH